MNDNRLLTPIITANHPALYVDANYITTLQKTDTISLGWGVIKCVPETTL